MIDCLIEEEFVELSPFVPHYKEVLCNVLGHKYISLLEHCDYADSDAVRYASLTPPWAGGLHYINMRNVPIIFRSEDGIDCHVCSRCRHIERVK